MEGMPATPPSVLFQHPSQSENHAEVCSHFLQEVLQEWNRNDSKHLHLNDDWVKVIDGLASHYIRDFPSNNDLEWSEATERVTFVAKILDFIQQAAVHVDGVYNASNDLAFRVFARLLDLCYTLDTWVLAPLVHAENLPSPQDLRQNARGAIRAVIRSLNHLPRIDEDRNVVEPRIFIGLLTECLDLCSDLISDHRLLVFPTRVALKSRPRSYQADDDSPLVFTIRKADHFPLILSLLLEIVTDILPKPGNSYPPLREIHRRVMELVRGAFDLCFSGAYPSTVRAKAMASLLSSSMSLLASNSEADNTPLSILDNLSWRVLWYHIQEGPRPEYLSCESALRAALEKRSGKSRCCDDVLSLLHAIRTAPWGNEGASLRELMYAFLTASLPSADKRTLNEVKRIVDSLEPSTQHQELLESIEKQMNPTPQSPRSNVVPSWPALVRDSLAEITSGEIILMDVDESDHQAYSKQAIEELRVHLNRQLPKFTDRARAAQQLNKFICLLASCDQPSNHRRLSLELVSAFQPVLARMLDGCEGDIYTSIRRCVYQVYRSIFLHQAPSIGSVGHGHALEVILPGIQDKNRGVRLEAGRSFVDFVLLCAMIDPPSTEPVLARLHSGLQDARHRVWETTLVTIGLLGRQASSDLLGQVVCSLISNLARQNPVLKGLAYIQLVEIAKAHQKSPYSLLLPHLSQIAPFLVSRICTQPNLLAETCHLISMSPTDFISTTLSHTLPRIFASCDTRVLDAVAKELNAKQSTLFVEHSHDILAHVFLLPSDLATDKALGFVLDILTSATGSADIGIPSVVKSCIVPLLAELVVTLGDSQRKQSAQDAIAKVEKCLSLAPLVKPKKKYGDEGLLKSCILGIIASINEMLQDVLGKKSVEFKRQIIRSLKELTRMMGTAIGNVAPQIMATFQSLVTVSELAEVTLQSWYTFLSTLSIEDLGLQIGPTSAALVSSWSCLPPDAKTTALAIFNYIVVTNGESLKVHLDDIGDLATIQELKEIDTTLCKIRGKPPASLHLCRILERASSENLAIVTQSLEELKRFLSNEHAQFVRELASGAVFDPLVSRAVSVLFSATCRDGDGTDSVRLLAYECIGILGAVDPDRCDIRFSDSQEVMLSNFEDDAESQAFAMHVVTELLVGAFRSTSDIKYQNQLAYSIQELLRFCKFTTALIGGSEEKKSVPLKTRQRWDALPKHVLETIAPLLEARFSLNHNRPPSSVYPIYPSHSTYREWMQVLTADLIEKVSGSNAQSIFGVLRSAIRHKDVSVAHFILPHLVLNILISGNDNHIQNIRSEIIVVLEDQIRPESNSPPDKRLLSAEAVFMLLDHLSKWVRLVRQKLAYNSSTSGSTSKRAPPRSKTEEDQLLKVDSILSSIDDNLMARAALQCKSYARALMNFERQVMSLREHNPRSVDLPSRYEQLHEIYAHLDQPDGMEGVSTLVLNPSLEHQIRQHESMGQWTSAQSGWEVRLQKEPDNLEFHLGLLRSLRNLGHYDTLRTHVKGILARNPAWRPSLTGFQVESAWMVGAWSEVQELAQIEESHTPSMVMARLLLAMRTADPDSIARSLRDARKVLGSPITASGAKSYRHCYDAVLNLHLTHELELISSAVLDLPIGSQANAPATRQNMIRQLSHILDSRLDATLPTFRVREPILGMRRTALALRASSHRVIEAEIGKSWVASAKNARKAGQWQTAYSAILQARQSRLEHSFMESAKLLKATGEPLHALQELEHSMRQLGLLDNADIDLTDEDPRTKLLKGKSQVLRARWMNESDRFDPALILKIFSDGADQFPKWEGGNYHLGQFHDNCFKELSPAEQAIRGIRMHVYTVRFFIKSLKAGSKHVFETVPRLLTIWLDVGADEKQNKSESFKKIHDSVSKAIKEIPAYKWYAAFPQIVSRLMHDNPEVAKSLASLMLNVMQEYPLQALWQFISAVNNKKDADRSARALSILSQIRNNPAMARTKVPMLVNETLSMTMELLKLCESIVPESRSLMTMSMRRDFPNLYNKGSSPLLIPLQESLSVTLPANSSQEGSHQPFPSDAPTFHEFGDAIEVMTSMARPKKISIKGSDGQIYMFLGKPKDDLRKDARLQDFFMMINQKLQGNAESRRRKLHIRTYGVATLNETSGFIQWVVNTAPIRPILLKLYKTRGLNGWDFGIQKIFQACKDADDKTATKIYLTKVLPAFPPVFRDWFLETFPEPSAWLAARMAYGRTLAVMSMVGFVLGLGDRHNENLLVCMTSGDVVHVDFNCIFEKGKSLEQPETVPFRLTQNLVDGLGVTGPEGVFRIACEITMQILRDNKDSLMSVLDAFIHDPLVEWQKEKDRINNAPYRRNQVKPSVDLRALAVQANSGIGKKLSGIYKVGVRPEKQFSTSNLVQATIQEAMDPTNLAKMYVGWAPFH